MTIVGKTPDKKKALDLIESANDDMKYTLSLEVSQESANTIVRNIYESFRMLGEAVLVNNGVKPLDHVICINELLKIDVETTRPLNLLENLRKLRHNVNYYGYKTTVHEAENAVSIAKSCFNPLYEEIKKAIKGKST